jgi:hypothetical protein
MVAVALFMFRGVIAQPRFDQKLPLAALRQDLTILRDSLEKLHPGIYRYRSKAEIGRIWDSCYGEIKDSMPVVEFYGLVRIAIASLEDGHTNCQLPRELVGDYQKNVKVFSAIVLFIHDHAYIYCCKQHESLVGAEIMSINGIAMSHIMDRLFAYIPSDAGIRSRKNWELPEFFSLLLNLVLGQQESYQITSKTREGKLVQTELKADLLQNVVCQPPAVFKPPVRWLQLTCRPGNIAILTIKTFLNAFLERSGENFSSFLDSAFKDMQMKGTKSLVIDLRRNQGGNDENGAMLYSHLAGGPFKFYDSLETTAGRLANDSHPNLSLQFPAPNVFRGKVYILADGRSFSGSSEFSSIVKTNRRGLFIGEENGGGYYGNTSGREIYLTLPASGISCRIPLVKYYLAVRPLKGGVLGIMPDFPMNATINDFLGRTDGQLEYAVKVAGN